MVPFLAFVLLNRFHVPSLTTTGHQGTRHDASRRGKKGLTSSREKNSHEPWWGGGRRDCYCVYDYLILLLYEGERKRRANVINVTEGIKHHEYISQQSSPAYSRHVQSPEMEVAAAHLRYVWKYIRIYLSATEYSSSSGLAS